MNMRTRPCLAAVVALAVPAFADSPFRPYGAAHFADVSRWDTRSNSITQRLFSAEHTIPTGVWDVSFPDSTTPLVSHHSVVLTDAISVDLHTRSIHEPDQPDFIETRGLSLFYLEFELTQTVPHPVFISRGADILLSMVHPSNRSWRLSASQTLPDLEPGYYNFAADTSYSSGHAGTLFLPATGTAAAFPALLLAARRRR